MITAKIVHSLRDSGKHPCGICLKAAESNSIFCTGKSSGYTGNVVASKVNWQLILHINIKDVIVFADQLVEYLRSR